MDGNGKVIFFLGENLKVLGGGGVEKVRGVLWFLYFV